MINSSEETLTRTQAFNISLHYGLLGYPRRKYNVRLSQHWIRTFYCWNVYPLQILTCAVSLNCKSRTC